MNIAIKILSLIFGIVVSFLFGIKVQNTRNMAKEAKDNKNETDTINKMDEAANNIPNDKQSLIDTLKKGEF
ncbi:MAG: hypothetical protein [Caudoviricetes sp.]|nr:MAG: hypothetical protein [Caudoviricetes sp.]